MRVVRKNGSTKNPRVAVVLTGGQSRRFGSNKATAKIGNQTFLEILTKTLRGSHFKVFLSTATTDLFPGGGPLQALHGAFSYYPFPKILFVACDIPLVVPVVLEELWKESAGADVAFLKNNGKVCPLPGVYSRKILSYSKKLLADGKRDLKSLLKTDLTTKSLPESHWQALDPEAKSIYNINTLKDLEFVSENLP